MSKFDKVAEDQLALDAEDYVLGVREGADYACAINAMIDVLLERDSSAFQKGFWEGFIAAMDL